ncbi:MAG: methyltransferase domain-containing protein [Planctomycetes bacterium]|nr:methyltransferase domain-containing protein [Planctomycetota bacterium]
MYILGISAFYHDSAAVLLRDGEIIAAAQEERFSRRKHDDAFPRESVHFCLSHANIRIQDVDYIGYYEKPLTKFERLLETYLAYAPRGFQSFKRALPLWLGKKVRLPRIMDKELGVKDASYVFCEHHESHAASAFFPSPFEEAAILTMDGVGEWATSSLARGQGNRIEMLSEIRFPHSLGMLYSAFTGYLGFKVNADEYKVMGLAPYGEPRFVDAILENLIEVREDGSFWMDMSFFDYGPGLTMTSDKFHALFGGPPKSSDAPIDQRHMDLAASVQKVTEEVVLKIARHLHEVTGSKNLCMAGGVALNCVANGRIAREGPFENIWIQPASGDAGGALGVAKFVWHQLLGNARTPGDPDAQHGSLLGPSYGIDEIERMLESRNATFQTCDDDALIERVTELLANGSCIGWFQGRMEYGPRALGCRSIIGDARDPRMQTTMNTKVKFRESFRPFAPCVLHDRMGEYFDLGAQKDSPYMLLVGSVREARRRRLTPEEEGLTGFDRLKVVRSDIPSTTHVDFSARVQTVDETRNPRLHELMTRFAEKTGSAVIVNTSFNLGWEPIVNRPDEAYHTFMASNLDALVLENCIVLKDRQLSEVENIRREDGREQDVALESLWQCPACGAELVVREHAATCAGCQQSFHQDDGIWQLFAPHEKVEGDVTEAVKAFYEETPFPNYDDHDNVRSLIEKSRRGKYGRLLGDQLPYNARILEVGCGTGQLSNFLAVGCRTVVGTDMCMNSLRLAENFRREQGLSRARFLQMNLFRPALRREQFDVVLCNGVLHHTSDPRGGFRSIAQLVKPGGHIVIGLYNTWGRLLLDFRRFVFRMTGGRARWIDSYLRGTPMSKEKQKAWFEDQYRHPHESKHTMGEVLEWFDEDGFDFVNGVPKLRPWEAFAEDENLFAPNDPGTAFDRAISQLKMIVTGSREGGFYIMIGRKRGGEFR